MQVSEKYFDGEDVEGEVGIEVEIEGANLPDDITFMHGVGHLWSHHSDGSLRGSSCEIVTNGPVYRDKVKLALYRAQRVFNENVTVITPSVRTGVHIHINIRHMTEEQVFIFMLLWLLLEAPMVQYCGEERVGNLFCLRSRDAESYLQELEKAIIQNDFNVLYTDDLRYSAMNPKALIEYGSLEFRCLKTTEVITDITEWVNLLLCIKDYSLTIEDPRKLLEEISLRGGYEIVEDIFKDMLPKLNVPADDWTPILYEGLRRIQPLVYAKKWATPESEDIIFNTELPQTIAEAKVRGALTSLEVVEYDIR